MEANGRIAHVRPSIGGIYNRSASGNSCRELVVNSIITYHNSAQKSRSSTLYELIERGIIQLDYWKFGCSTSAGRNFIANSSNYVLKKKERNITIIKGRSKFEAVLIQFPKSCT